MGGYFLSENNIHQINYYPVNSAVVSMYFLDGDICPVDIVIHPGTTGARSKRKEVLSVLNSL